MCVCVCGIHVVVERLLHGIKTDLTAKAYKMYYNNHCNELFFVARSIAKCWNFPYGHLKYTVKDILNLSYEWIKLNRNYKTVQK